MKWKSCFHRSSGEIHSCLVLCAAASDLLWPCWHCCSASIPHSSLQHRLHFSDAQPRWLSLTWSLQPSSRFVKHTFFISLVHGQWRQIHIPVQLLLNVIDKVSKPNGGVVLFATRFPSPNETVIKNSEETCRRSSAMRGENAMLSAYVLIRLIKLRVSGWLHNQNGKIFWEGIHLHCFYHLSYHQSWITHQLGEGQCWAFRRVAVIRGRCCAARAGSYCDLGRHSIWSAGTSFHWSCGESQSSELQSIVTSKCSNINM